MIPAVAKRGTSFKGAGLYYLHDKRREGEQTRDTSERVAWTHTRNLATDDPDFSLRIMAATAMDKERLKQQAGIKNTGRKTKGDVYAYSVSWHPEEAGKFDKAAMLEAAEQSLEALGASEHQALIVAHQDEAHPHVHIIVNMVNPTNGKNLATSNDFRKLDKWAYEYRREREEEYIYAPKRAKKHEAIAERKRGNVVPFVRGDKNIPRSIYKEFDEARDTTERTERREGLNAQRAADLKLSQTGKHMASRHKNQWTVLSREYADKKQLISREYFKAKKQGTAEIQQANKTLFAEMKRRQWTEQKRFERFEKTLGGRIQNALAAMRENGDRNIIKAAFNLAYRRSAMTNRHAQQLRDFRASEKRSIADEVKRLNARRLHKLSQARIVFSADRHALIKHQDVERDDLKAAWRTRNARKAEAFAVLKAKRHFKEHDEIVRPPNAKGQKETLGTSQQRAQKRGADDILAKQQAKAKAKEKLADTGKLTPEEEELLDQSEVVEAKREFKRGTGKRRSRARVRKRTRRDD